MVLAEGFYEPNCSGRLLLRELILAMLGRQRGNIQALCSKATDIVIVGSIERMENINYTKP